MADRYKDRLKILEDQEIEELYGRPQFNHDERVHLESARKPGVWWHDGR